MSYAVRVTTPATTRRLCTLAEARQRKGKASSDTSEDTLFGDLLDFASEQVAKFAGRELALQVYSELTTGAAYCRELWLSRCPVEPSSVAITLAGVTQTGWAVRDRKIGVLYRALGWPLAEPFDADGVEQLVAVYRGGYVLPDQVDDWQTNHEMTAGEFLRVPGNPYLMEVTDDGGTTHATIEPTWPTTVGGTVNSGDVEFTAVELEELPKPIQDATYLTFDSLLVNRPAGLQQWREGDAGEMFHVGALEDIIPLNARRVLRRYFGF